MRSQLRSINAWREPARWPWPASALPSARAGRRSVKHRWPARPGKFARRRPINTLESAIADASFLIDAFKQGTSEQPPEGSQEWYELRAAMLGLAFLRRLVTLEIGGKPDACERVYKKCLAVFKAAADE